MDLAGIPADCSPSVAVSGRPEFGDYQANSVLAAAKLLRCNPRELAGKVVANLDLEDIAERVEIAGPGFLNIHLSKNWLANQLNSVRSDPRLGVAKQTSKKIVVDYSSPNLAKEMHVGHLRSTIIGDAVVRVLNFLGHQVVKQNHMGDWGTQFGMLIAELDDYLQEGEPAEFALSDLERFYRQAKQHFDSDPEFAERARNYVVRLQAGDTHCLQLWKRFIAVSIEHSEQIYHSLNVTLRPEDIRPESAYNDQLSAVVDQLRDQKLLVEDAGAHVVFLEELADKNGKPSVAIIQKKDGGYLYATTDLAAICYRVESLQADRVLYFIDDRQSLHMRQVFAIARNAGWAPESVELTHCSFGTMMGSDGKPFKTRSGETIKLSDLVDEAVDRATDLVRDKNPNLPDEESDEIGRKVGIGAIKYADLSKTRTNDYLFNWNSMLAFEGNTAPYLQYACTRIYSIFRKAELDVDSVAGSAIVEEPAEKNLAIKLLQFGEVVEQVGERAYPHELCTYLFDLAVLYMTFYEQCPVLKDEVTEDTRDGRLQLCAITLKTLERGLDLLGIESMERM